MDNTFYLVTLAWLCVLLIIMLCDVPIDVGVLFCFKSDGQYIIVSDTIMAVFLFSSILCVVPIDRGCSFLLKVRWTIYLSW